MRADYRSLPLADYLSQGLHHTTQQDCISRRINAIRRCSGMMMMAVVVGRTMQHALIAHCSDAIQTPRCDIADKGVTLRLHLATKEQQ